MAGQLSVFVIEAAKMPQGQWYSRPDPYVVARLGLGPSKRTSVRPTHGKKVRWMQDLVFDVQENELKGPLHLTVEIRDQRITARNRLLGRLSLDCSPVIHKGEEITGAHTLFDDNPKSSGTLRLEIRFHSSQSPVPTPTTAPPPSTRPHPITQSTSSLPTLTSLPVSDPPPALAHSQRLPPLPIPSSLPPLYPAHPLDVPVSDPPPSLSHSQRLPPLPTPASPPALYPTHPLDVPSGDPAGNATWAVPFGASPAANPYHAAQAATGRGQGAMPERALHASWHALPVSPGLATTSAPSTPYRIAVPKGYVPWDVAVAQQKEETAKERMRRSTTDLVEGVVVGGYGKAARPMS